MKWIWGNILLNTNTENQELKMKNCQTFFTRKELEDEGNKKGYLVKHNHALLWFMRKIQSQKISYQTPILRLKICLWEGNQKKLLSENLKVLGIKAKNLPELSHLKDFKWK